MKFYAFCTFGFLLKFMCMLVFYSFSRAWIIPSFIQVIFKSRIILFSFLYVFLSYMVYYKFIYFYLTFIVWKHISCIRIVANILLWLILLYMLILNAKYYPRHFMCSVTQLCLTLWDPLDCNQPGSSVHGLFQPKILEWVAISESISPMAPAFQVDSLPLSHGEDFTYAN